jgi:hypothetical protein
VVTSFGGVPSANGFAKRYELPYQLKKMEVEGSRSRSEDGSLMKFFHKKLAYVPCSKPQTKQLNKSDEKTNQQDRNDPHKVTKLAKEEWD